MHKILDWQILNKFCSDHPDRPTLSKPFLNGNYVCATDTFTAIRVPLGNIEWLFSPMEKPISQFQSFFQITNWNENLIPVESWWKNLQKLKTEDEWQDWANCEKCEWEWIIYCDQCDHENDCEKCKGTGKKEKDKLTGRKTYKRYGYVSINDTVVIHAGYLERIIETYNQLPPVDMYDIFVKVGSSKDPVMFIVRHPVSKSVIVEILVMPVLSQISDTEYHFYT